MNEFKVGDWVKYGEMIYDCGAEYMEYSYGIVDTISDDYTHIKDCGQFENIYIELFEPQNKEYHWFWNKGDTKPVLNQFSKMCPIEWGEEYIGKYLVLIPEIAYAKDAAEYYSIRVFDYCEPFIGTLPSIIKTQHV